jgi:hypothetical protein
VHDQSVHYLDIAEGIWRRRGILVRRQPLLAFRAFRTHIAHAFTPRNPPQMLAASCDRAEDELEAGYFLP